MSTSDVFKAGMNHIDKVRVLISGGQILWSQSILPITDKVPKPENVARGFVGNGSGYTVAVMQANTKEYGIVHVGALQCPSPPHVVNLPPAVADEFFHAAAARHN
jgi:hypothetical protein